MKVPERYLRVVSAVGSVGSVGASLLLGSALAGAAADNPAGPSGAPGVADRLAIIREAVLITGTPAVDAGADPDIHPAWGYRWFNGGRGGWGNFRPRWNNFRPRWNNFWRNW